MGKFPKSRRRLGAQTKLGWKFTFYFVNYVPGPGSGGRRLRRGPPRSRNVNPGVSRPRRPGWRRRTRHRPLPGREMPGCPPIGKYISKLRGRWPRNARERGKPPSTARLAEVIGDLLVGIADEGRRKPPALTGNAIYASSPKWKSMPLLVLALSGFLEVVGEARRRP